MSGTIEPELPVKFAPIVATAESVSRGSRCSNRRVLRKERARDRRFLSVSVSECAILESNLPLGVGERTFIASLTLHSKPPTSVTVDQTDGTQLYATPNVNRSPADYKQFKFFHEHRRCERRPMTDEC